MYLLYMIIVHVLLTTDSTLLPKDQGSTRKNMIFTYNVCEDNLLEVGQEIPIKQYTLYGEKEFLCDTNTDGGRWIVVQIRKNRGTNFSRNWESYKAGFGTVDTDYWLGNEWLYTLTSFANYELLIQMKSNDERYFVRYDSFGVANERNLYYLRLGKFKKGNVTDSFVAHRYLPFSTYDNDNDWYNNGNCAKLFSSGWWFTDCLSVNLNGKFNEPGNFQGIYWKEVTEGHPIIEVRMQIRIRRNG